MTRCPNCRNDKKAQDYLCRICWYALSPAARRSLNRRDDSAGLRRLELHRQLRDDVPLAEIRISA